MGALFIGTDERREIIEAVAKARQNPMPWEAAELIIDHTPTDTLKLNDRPPNTTEIRKRYQSQGVVLGSYQIAISFEHQPAGLFRHLSISSGSRGKVPGLEVLMMVLEEFGFSGWPLQRPNRIWMEEYLPGRHAINVIELEEAA
jgi:hypothetical protein